MRFDIASLNSFRNVDLGGNNAIANLGQDDNVVKKKNSCYGSIGKVFRLGNAKSANNAVRTEFLRSLGNVFGLSGMAEQALQSHHRRKVRGRRLRRRARPRNGGRQGFRGHRRIRRPGNRGRKRPPRRGIGV